MQIKELKKREIANKTNNIDFILFSKWNISDSVPCGSLNCDFFVSLHHLAFDDIIINESDPAGAIALRPRPPSAFHKDVSSKPVVHHHSQIPLF